MRDVLITAVIISLIITGGKMKNKKGMELIMMGSVFFILHFVGGCFDK